MIGIGLHIGNRVMGGGGGFDADAQAFFDRVTTAGGTLTTTEKNATNQLVLDMKSAGIWTAMKAVYPMVGASANLLSYTEDFGNAYWGKNGATVTVNDTIAPNGTMTADKVVFGSSNNYLQGSVVQLNLGTCYHLIWVKGTAGETVFFDDGYVSIANVTLTGNWQKVEFYSDRGSGQYQGIGIGTYNGATARTIWLWGAQVSVGSTATTYAPVAGSRTAEAAAACAQNLKSSSFTGTFTATGWTFASTGVKGNGSSTYMDTSLTPSGSLSQNSTHLSFYSRTTGNLASHMVEMGSYGNSSGANATYLVTSYSSTIYPNLNSQESAGGSTPYTNRLGLKMFNRVDSSNVRVFNNGTFLQSYARTSTTLNNLSLYVGAYHRDDTTTLSNDFECAFASIGDGLTDTQASNLYTAVQAFQTTLSRQV